MSRHANRKQVALGVAIAIVLSSSSAVAARPRVVVAGDDEDAVTPRVVRELTALGLEPVRVGPSPGCESAALGNQAMHEGARAALCTSADSVLVWSMGRALRLVETLPLHGVGPDERALVAIRAAEATRAYVEADRARAEALEAEERSTEESLSALAAAHAVLSTSLAVPRDQRRVLAPGPPHTETFSVGVGSGMISGVGPPVSSVTAMGEIGGPSVLAPFVRIDVPLSASSIDRTGGSVRVSPGLAALGLNIPLLPAQSVLIPRVGVGAGIAWLSVTETRAFNPLDTTNAEVGSVSPGMALSGMGFAQAALSLRIVDPVRLAADAALGATTSRMTARGFGTTVAEWGRPFGALAVRAEILVP